MILQALTDYYERLAQDPEQDIAPFGYSRQKVSFAVVIKLDGTLVQFSDCRSSEDGKPRPQMLTLPGQSKPTGQGINPCFLWDQPHYLLGFKADDRKPERTRQTFEAFRDRHLGLESEIDDPHFSAVCRFLQWWSPDHCAKHADTLAEIAVAFGVFRINGETAFVHQRPAVERYWNAQIGTAESDCVAPSLIDGEPQPIARLHEPKIKNVNGAQSSGAAIVSFNRDAFESYGKSQSYNAPVGVGDAFRYATALDHLTGDNARRVRMADATLVFWSERPTAFEQGLPAFFDDYRDRSADDATQVSKVKQFFIRLVTGRAANADEAAVPFYVLGLSPNGPRLSIRIWLESTVGDFAAHLARHVADLQIGYAREDGPPLTIRRILDQTARERKDVSPLLEGAVLRAVLTGGPYPLSLMGAVLRRIRADGRVDSFRASILKAYLTRSARLSGAREESLMSLNRHHPNPAYHLGRLFAVLEKTQEEAFGGSLNATIKDRYFSSASANPVAAFPRLMRMHTHHLNKLTNPGRRVNLEKLVGETYGRLADFPANLSLPDQGLFFVGYYHQYQSFFEKRSGVSAEPEATTTISDREGN